MVKRGKYERNMLPDSFTTNVGDWCVAWGQGGSLKQ